MNDDTITSPNSARRRLVRGAFAAPAALTLVSGSTLAAASSQCVANQVNSSSPALPGPTTSATADTWVRVPVWSVGNGNGNLSTWVSGADMMPLVNNNTSMCYLSSGQWQCLSAGASSGYTVGQIVSTQPTSRNSTLARNGSYVAVRVDASGRIIGVVGVGTGGSAVGQSCWASFSVTV